MGLSFLVPRPKMRKPIVVDSLLQGNDTVNGT